MDPSVTEKERALPLRRSTRQAQVKVSFEVTSRAPIKRSKRGLESRVPGGKVNGTKEAEDSSEDEESPSKKRRDNPLGAEDGRGDANNVDMEELGEEAEGNEDQRMDAPQDYSHPTHLQKTLQGSHRPPILYPRVALGERCEAAGDRQEDRSGTKLTHPAKAPAAPIEPSVRNRSGTNKHAAPPARIRSMAEYRQTMEHKARSSGFSSENLRINYRDPSVYQAPETAKKLTPLVNNNSVQKQPPRPPLKKVKTESVSVDKESSGSSSRGFMWAFLAVVLLLLLGSVTLLPHRVLPSFQRTAGGWDPQSKAAKAEKLSDRLSLLETRFPSQRPEVWRRSRIHLEKHLLTEHPPEPVSLILTAGRGAEKTLRCLARRLAESFSSVHNASVLHVDGDSTAGRDGDQVKLDIDNQLQAAFEGKKPAAVIHRFEELPPSSTLIFYRYCDHENAAYKKVFLLFTVLLPQDEVTSDKSLKEVEELVQDYLEDRLVGSGSPAAFNEMDTDKYGGLWSRISHLVLPVVSEQQVEQKGC